MAKSHVPLDAVSVEPISAVPLISGTADEVGARMSTGPSDVEYAAVAPPSFVAVTRTRRYLPSSERSTSYSAESAPSPSAASHVEPSADDSHAYA